jgi:hypothetical protein
MRSQSAKSSGVRVRSFWRSSRHGDTAFLPAYLVSRLEPTSTTTSATSSLSALELHVDDVVDLHDDVFDVVVVVVVVVVEINEKNERNTYSTLPFPLLRRQAESEMLLRESQARRARLTIWVCPENGIWV